MYIIITGSAARYNLGARYNIAAHNRVNVKDSKDTVHIYLLYTLRKPQPFSRNKLRSKAVDRGDKRTRRVRDRDFVKFE